MDEYDNELPDLPFIDKGPPPDCPICGDPMGFIDGDWACVDCNGELLRRIVRSAAIRWALSTVTGPASTATANCWARKRVKLIAREA
ncbi:MAG: hypothetical protein HP491_12465 [Nitrospira sp.]|nr:hypothetical protein [Nitrospira sp.]